MEEAEQVERLALGDLLGVVKAVGVQHRGRAGILVVDVAADLDVGQHGQVLEETDVLERARHAQRGDVVCLVTGGRLATDEDLPLGRLIHAGEHVEDGGLPRAVRSDQSHQLVRLEREVEVAHRGEAAEADGDVPSLE